MKTLFLAWQNQKTRRWFPIGRLTKLEAPSGYQFEYTRGAEIACREGGFQALYEFKELDVVYESEELFPLFANRVMNRSRPDFAASMEQLGLKADPAVDPLEVLARSGGRRLTDDLEVFAEPEALGGGEYRTHFFVRGVRHMPEASIERANHLGPGEELRLVHDFQNPSDPHALLLRTAESSPQDVHLLGYCPRYLFADTFDSLVRDQKNPRVRIVRLNPPPAPIHYRLLCEARFRLRAGVRPFTSDRFRPIVSELAPAGA